MTARHSHRAWQFRVSTVIRMSSALASNGFDQTEVLRVTDHANSAAREVHALLLEAHPEAHNANLAKAAHLAETAGDHSDQFQLDTLIAIRELQTAIKKRREFSRKGAVIIARDKHRSEVGDGPRIEKARGIAPGIPRDRWVPVLQSEQTTRLL
jgi:hypothetical protein